MRTDFSSIQLDDLVINDREKVEFVIGCIWQIHGFPGTDEKLEKNSLLQQADMIEHSWRLARDNNEKVLKLHTDATTLKRVCESVIDNLEDYQDLENILVIDYKQAKKLISELC